MDRAFIFMSLLRPSGVPVAGESWEEDFKGQIEVTGWKWGFEHDEEEQTRKAPKADAAKPEKSRSVQKSIQELKSVYDKGIDRLKRDPGPREVERFDRDLQKNFADLQRDSTRVDQENRRNDERNEDLQTQPEEEADAGEPDRKFTFEKRVDLATTQLLNALKAHEVFPMCMLTMMQKSSNNPMNLVIKVQGLRLIDYKLNIAPSDTMTDLLEEWTCSYEGFSYVYQNRRSFSKPGVGSVSDAKQVAAKAATQGTARTFVMKNFKLLG